MKSTTAGTVAASDAVGPCAGTLREFGEKLRTSNLRTRKFGSARSFTRSALRLTVASASERSNLIGGEPRELSCAPQCYCCTASPVRRACVYWVERLTLGSGRVPIMARRSLTRIMTESTPETPTAPPADASAAASPSPCADAAPGSHVEAACEGPTEDNPSLSIKKRIKRAQFFDQREQLVAAGLAVSVEADAGLPDALTEPASASDRSPATE